MKEITLPKNLPSFNEQRRGTQVFAVINSEITCIYDDLSCYPDGDAYRWRVRVYNACTGIQYDHLCMNGGLYFSYKRVLAEIERFRHRKCICAPF